MEASGVQRRIKRGRGSEAVRNPSRATGLGRALRGGRFSRTPSTPSFQRTIRPTEEFDSTMITRVSPKRKPILERHREEPLSTGGMKRTVEYPSTLSTDRRMTRARAMSRMDQPILVRISGVPGTTTEQDLIGFLRLHLRAFQDFSYSNVSPRLYRSLAVYDLIECFLINRTFFPFFFSLPCMSTWVFFLIHVRFFKFVMHEEVVSFIVEKVAEGRALSRLSGIRLGGHKLIITIGTMSNDNVNVTMALSPEEKETSMKLWISTRYHGDTSFLDVSQLKYDERLKEIGLKPDLSSKSFTQLFLKAAKEVCPATTSISFAKNYLDTLEALQQLSIELPAIQHLNLERNHLSRFEDLDPLIGLAGLIELILTGNPLCYRHRTTEQKAHYRR